MNEKVFEGLRILGRLACANGINIFQHTVNGRRLRKMEFTLLLFMLTQEVDREIDRRAIISGIYSNPEKIKDKSIDPIISRLNSSLKDVKFDFLIKNDGNGWHPKGFYLAKI